MTRKFLIYVAPSVLAFALSGVYSIVDGFFVGNNIGDIGLAAINVAYPVQALFQAIGTGIGMGGAVLYSLCSGPAAEGQRQRYFNWTILLLILSSIILAGIVLLASKHILFIFGASGQLLQMGVEYLRVLAFGAAFQVLGTGVIPLIRNMGAVIFAMAAMITGFITNIFLDYLFIWVYSWGLAGAALATVIGQAATFAMCLIFLRHRKTVFSAAMCFKSPSLAKKILLVAISPFGLTFSPNITLILMNRFALFYGNQDAAAVYATIAYISCIVLFLLQGVGDGSQPLISMYYGEKQFYIVRRLKILAYAAAGSLSILCMAILFFGRQAAAAIFGASPHVQFEVVRILPFFLTGYIFIAYVRTTTACFYATGKNIFAYLLIYGEPAVLLICLLILPQYLNLFGVWLSVPVSQYALALMGSIIQIYDSRRKAIYTDCR